MGDWVRRAPGAPGFERIEAFFAGHGFDPHRHDTYAIGYTMQGVQAFRYRGETARSLPGQVFVLHPDETHDGRAGTGAGFRYRILYVAPRHIRAALGDRPCALPFVPGAVSRDRRLARAIASALDDLAAPLEPLQLDQAVLELAEALTAASDAPRRWTASARDRRAVDRARDYLDANLEQPVASADPKPVSSADLEAVTGLSRYTLARQFRACLGTSPHRYLVLRRLDRARAMLGQGTPVAEVALACGFADQSHLTRRFKQACGVTPGRWRALAG